MYMYVCVLFRRIFRQGKEYLFLESFSGIYGTRCILGCELRQRLARVSLEKGGIADLFDGLMRSSCVTAWHHAIESL